MSETQRGREAAVLLSGGVDSAVLAVEMLGAFERVHSIYVRFGLRWEAAELAHLRRFLAAVAGSRPGLAPLTVLDEPVGAVYGDHWSRPAAAGVPSDESRDEAVYLPGRNVLLASKAAVWCALRGVETLAFGTLRGNPFPDATPRFFREFEGVLNLALGTRLRIVRPLERFDKAEVVRRGAGLPLHLTFSCLDPVEGAHCGACNKCAERRKGFRRAGLEDSAPYACEPAGLRGPSRTT